jgi:hypothetical protein
MHDMIGSAGMLRGWMEVWSAHMLLLLATLMVRRRWLNCLPHICGRHGQQLRSIRSILTSRAAFSVRRLHMALVATV